MDNQVAALTYQSQLTASTAATTNQCNAQQLATIEANEEATHSTLHQIIAQLNAVRFNASDAGRGRFGGCRRGRAVAMDFVVGRLNLCPTDFPLPMVVESHHHHLPMVVAFLPVEEVMVDINEALPSLPGISS
jgi:hypothetical protein